MAIHKWKEGQFGYEEEYVSDLLFSTNLSFIPVDLQFGPRGDLYICDWYNPVKGHAQYSLRDERRDRHSGRIWRITTKGKPTQEPPRIAEATIPELLEMLKRPEYRIRYWSKRELREREPAIVRRELDRWLKDLKPSDPRFRHHQLEAVWTYRWLGEADIASVALPVGNRMNGTHEKGHRQTLNTNSIKFYRVRSDSVAARTACMRRSARSSCGHATIALLASHVA